MNIDKNVAIFNIACNVVNSMKLKGLTSEEILMLADHIRIAADCEFPKPEEPSPIIVPTTAEVKEVSEVK